MPGVARRARSKPGEPIFGHGWDVRGWPEARPPTMAELDRAAGPVVAYLARVDMHSAVVSTGLVAAVPTIVEAPGYTDGLVRREANHLARRATRNTITPDRRRALHQATLRRAAAHASFSPCPHSVEMRNETGTGDGLHR